MKYDVKTRVFEGPLELLLELITSRRVEITELSLAELVNEYLAYLDAMRQLDLDVTSEFLVIATTLIQMKARRLLPEDREVDLDEELALAEERDRLLSRLLACLTFKDVAAVMAHRLETHATMVGRDIGLDAGIEGHRPEVDLRIGAAGLADLAAKVLARRRSEPQLDHLDLDLPSVALAIDDIRARVAGEVETDFDRLTDHLARPVEVIAYFLAMLELARWGLVSAEQEHLEASIRLRHVKDTGDGLVSEWSL